MPSPFPGMNPYLERATAWEDFRLPLTVGIRHQLAARLPPRYHTRLGSRTYTHEQSAEERRRGDAIDHEKLRYVAIHDGEEVVTVVEFLHPITVHDGPHRERYLSEVHELLRSRVNVVEINLFRHGPELPAYCAAVLRPEGGVVLWWQLRDPIPLIPVPLRAGDADATLDLKAAIDQMYDGGRYANYIYNGPPEPRLAPDDAAWAAQFLPTNP